MDQEARKRRVPPPLLLLTLALALPRAQSTTFKITTPYALYICPEGQKVTLTCKLSGSLASHHDSIYKFWYFSNQGDQSCSQKKHVRNVSAKELHHESEKHSGQRVSHHGLEFSSDHHGTFYVTMANLTLKDSGNYCCYVVEAEKEHNKAHAKQQAHGFMELRIQKANATFPNCTLHSAASMESESAHELVRMESNTHGIENPVFDDIPTINSEPKARPQLSYMASRQLSESGRHLLSEPNTPLSPPAPGDCFFPTLEPVPDSPNTTNA
uniref:V-type immunoglobulin domain-containing suppressor of T-cell activation isoform X2 n=1 Tax=Podarcis muralis TaxID=64176 RepID=UPI00109F887C|nr:V-type immunoglobulin domain-containing suppressor of T-cell activation isoform X2 [Podarcis muralis]